MFARVCGAVANTGVTGFLNPLVVWLQNVTKSITPWFTINPTKVIFFKFMSVDILDVQKPRSARRRVPSAEPRGLVGI